MTSDYFLKFLDEAQVKNDIYAKGAKMKTPAAWLYILCDGDKEIDKFVDVERFDLSDVGPFGKENQDYPQGFTVKEIALYTG